MRSALGVWAALTLGPAVAQAQPAGSEPDATVTAAPPPSTSTSPSSPPPTVAEPSGGSATPSAPPSAPVQQPTTIARSTAPETTAGPPASTTASPSPGATSGPVDDAAWNALQGRQVVVQSRSGAVRGELLRSEGDTLVLMRDGGEVLTVPKANATGVRVVQPPSAPATDGEPSAAESMAELSPSSEDDTQDEAGDDTTAEGQDDDASLTPAQERRKERRDKREHALLGAFTMHGATYTHWRGDGVQSGHASYAMDWGLGLNLSPSFGMYAMAGGLLGARIENKQTKANYGHVAFVFAFSRKYFFSTVGAGGAFSRLRFADGTLQKDRGLAIPTRLVGKIPLPHKLYLGIGITYELGLVRGFSRAINGIGGQIVVGRW